MKAVSFVETAMLPVDATEACLAQVLVEYAQEDSERYLLPLTFAWGDRAEQVRRSAEGSILVELEVTSKDKTRNGVVYDAVLDEEFCAALLDMIMRRKQIRGTMGEFVATPGKGARNPRTLKGMHFEVSSMRAEQTNSSIIYGDRFILKLFRQVEEGINPDLEVGRFLSERAGFGGVPERSPERSNTKCPVIASAP